LPDIAVPDATTARKFRLLCEQLVMKRDLSVKPELKAMLQSWIENHEKLRTTANGIPALTNWIKMSEELTKISSLGLECLDFMDRRQVITDEWTKQAALSIQDARKPYDEAELMVVDAINMLFNHTLPK